MITTATKDSNNTTVTLANRDALLKMSKKLVSQKNKTEAICKNINTKMSLVDDDGNPTYKQEELQIDLASAAAAAEEFTKMYAETAYDFALKQADPAVALAKIGMLPVMTARLVSKTKDGEAYTEAVASIKDTLIDYKAFKAYADKEAKASIGDYGSALTALHNDSVTAGLQAIYLEASDENHPDDAAKLAAVKKYASSLDSSEWKAVQELNTIRSKKVELALLRAVVDALAGEGKITVNKKHVAWLNNVVVSKGKNILSLSVVKRDTMLKLVTEIMVASVNDLDLEVNF